MYSKIVLCLLVYFFGNVLSIVDYCSENKFDSNSTYMQFTKEVSSSEYTKKGSFKGLHCCSKGYRSIEWYKDGRPYPWPGDVSSFILYPESANQTIYAQTTASSDTGIYMCVLRNDTHLNSRLIDLQVIDKLPDVPKATFNPNDQFVELGSTARLFCEAFVGLVDLPDAENEISWRRPNSNGTIVPTNRISVDKVAREDNQILGAYLTIRNIEEDDFGQYICKINNPDTFIELKLLLREKEFDQLPNSNPVPWTKILMTSVAIMLLLATIVAINLRFGLSFRVKCKDRFGTIEANDGKSNDVLICYSRHDNEIVLGVLVPVLENQYNYKCRTMELPSPVGIWLTELQSLATNSRRMMTVLSPTCFDNKWDSTTVTAALEQLVALNTPVICVTLKQLPTSEIQQKNSQGQTLKSLLNKVAVVNWVQPNDSQFWLALRLHLPARRNDPSTDSNSTSTRLSVKSRESLEILV